MGHKNRKYIPYRDSIQEYRKNEIGKKIDHEDINKFVTDKNKKINGDRNEKNWLEYKQKKFKFKSS